MRKIYVLLAATTILSAAPAFAVSKPNANVAAIVNGEAITKAQLSEKAIDWQGAMTLDELIDATIVAQAAKKAGVVVTNADVNKKLAEIKKMLGVTSDQEFDAALRPKGTNISHLAARIKTSIQAEGATRKWIKSQPAFLANYRNASHILIRVNPAQDGAQSLASDAEAKAKIEKIMEEIKTTGNFEEAAKKYSEDPMSKVNGGNLGFFTKGAMMPEFENAVFALKPGEISAPIKTGYGYHLIKLIAIGSEAKGDDLKKLEDQIAKDKIAEWFTDARKKAKIENVLYPVKAATKTVAPKKGMDTPPAAPVAN